MRPRAHRPSGGSPLVPRRSTPATHHSGIAATARSAFWGRGLVNCGPTLENKGFGERFAKRLPQNGPEAVAGFEGQTGTAAGEDAELARVVAAWPDLPDHIQAAVLALVDSGGPRRSPPKG